MMKCVHYTCVYVYVYMYWVMDGRSTIICKMRIVRETGVKERLGKSSHASVFKQLNINIRSRPPKNQE